MKVGIFFEKGTQADLTAILFMLQGGKVGFDEEELRIDNFQIKYKNTIFYFTSDLEKVRTCDKKVLTCSINSQHFLQPHINSFDCILTTSADGENYLNSNERIREVLQRPNSLHLSAHTVADDLKKHKRLVVDPVLNLYHMYYAFGYQFINFYKSDEKDHLVGVYNRYGAGYKRNRQELLDFLQNYLQHPIEVYKSDGFLGNDTLLEDKISWLKTSQHNSTYIDYNRAAANFIFETHGYGRTENLIFTEKTLKALLFQRAYIFFIYLGSPGQMEYLHEKGFWFLNSDFIGKPYSNNSIQYRMLKDKYGVTESDTFYSALHTFEYLVNLKRKLQTDNAVYQHLMSLHKDKIDNNIAILKKLLTTCNYVDKLEKLLKAPL